MGYDLHRLQPGRKLILGGCEIPSEVGALAHSDGDALIHAVIDAMLGGACLQDIGTHFPPDNPDYKGISSRFLLRETHKLVESAGYRILNLDCTVVLESPRLRPFIDAIRRNIAQDLEMVEGSVSVKAKTGEGVGPVGEGRAVEAHSVVLLEHPEKKEDRY
jgi:2-C-methyl-D-erythritol 2,4-cyclodiphosphate synthase